MAQEIKDFCKGFTLPEPAGSEAPRRRENIDFDGDGQADDIAIITDFTDIYCGPSMEDKAVKQLIVFGSQYGGGHEHVEREANKVTVTGLNWRATSTWNDISTTIHMRVLSLSRETAAGCDFKTGKNGQTVRIGDFVTTIDDRSYIVFAVDSEGVLRLNGDAATANPGKVKLVVVPPDVMKQINDPSVDASRKRALIDASGRLISPKDILNVKPAKRSNALSMRGSGDR